MVNEGRFMPIEGIQTTVKPGAKFTADSGAITVNAVIYAL